jgi:hypothetical protein
MHIFFAVSTDQGKTWHACADQLQTPCTASKQRIDKGNLVGDSWQPALAVDPGTGAVVIAWYDRRDDANNTLYRPYYTQSAAGGMDFAAATPAAQIPLTSVQSDPRVDCNGTGDYLGITSTSGKAIPVWTDTEINNSPEGLPAVFAATIAEASFPGTTEWVPTSNARHPSSVLTTCPAEAACTCGPGARGSVPGAAALGSRPTQAGCLGS